MDLYEKSTYPRDPRERLRATSPGVWLGLQVRCGWERCMGHFEETGGPFAMVARMIFR